MKRPSALQLTGAIVVTVVAAQSLGVFVGGAPSIVSPFPLPLVFLLLLGVPWVLLPLLMGLAFVLWNSRSDVLPRRTLVLVAAVALLSGAWFLVGWPYGVRYQGLEHTLICAVLSGVLLIVTILQSWLAIRSRSRADAIVTHMILFAWASSYAFPYFGELC